MNFGLTSKSDGCPRVDPACQVTTFSTRPTPTPRVASPISLSPIVKESISFPDNSRWPPQSLIHLSANLFQTSVPQPLSSTPAFSLQTAKICLNAVKKGI